MCKMSLVYLEISALTLKNHSLNIVATCLRIFVFASSNLYLPVFMFRLIFLSSYYNLKINLITFWIF